MKTPIAGNSFPPRPIPDADTYPARNIMIADLGTQDETFNGQPKKLRKIWFCFELVGTKQIFDPAKGEQPFVVSEEYTLSLSDKANLRKFLQSWSGKQIEELTKYIDADGNLDIMKTFAGQACAVTVVHRPNKKDKTKKYANIGAITPPIKALGPVPKSENPLIIYDMEDTATHSNFEKLPKFIREKISKSYEFQGASVTDVSDDFSTSATEEETPF